MYTNNQKGITLLITLLLMGVLLGVSTSLLNVTLKQYQLSNLASASEIAFQAANAGMECLLHRDFTDEVFVSPVGAPRISLECFGESSNDLNTTPVSVNSGDEQRFQFTWGSNPQVCTDVSIYKFYDNANPVSIIVNGVNLRPGVSCPSGSLCTVIQSRGYNAACSDLVNNLRVVEREYTQVY